MKGHQQHYYLYSLQALINVFCIKKMLLALNRARSLKLPAPSLELLGSFPHPGVLQPGEEANCKGCSYKGSWVWYLTAKGHVRSGSGRNPEPPVWVHPCIAGKPLWAAPCLPADHSPPLNSTFPPNEHKQQQEASSPGTYLLHGSGQQCGYNEWSGKSPLMEQPLLPTACSGVFAAGSLC